MTIIANFVCGWLNYQKSITFSTDPPFSFDPDMLMNTNQIAPYIRNTSYIVMQWNHSIMVLFDKRDTRPPSNDMQGGSKIIVEHVSVDKLCSLIDNLR